MTPPRRGFSALPANTDAALLRVENDRLKILLALVVPAAASYDRRVEGIGRYAELMPYLAPDDLTANIVTTHRGPGDETERGVNP